MANYSTSLKTWGDTGAEFPDGYNHLEGEQPVDAWDNFYKYHSIQDLKHLIELTNDRIESSKGTSYPSSPEDGEFCWRGDLREVHVYDQDANDWHDVLFADGDTMSGVLNMGNYQIEDLGKLLFPEDGGSRTLADLPVTSSAAAGTEESLGIAVDGKTLLKVYAESDGAGSVQNGHVVVQDAPLDQDWFFNHDGGSVASGTLVPVGTFGLDDGQTLEVTQASFTQDGFTSPASSGLDLVIVPEGAAVEGDTTKILSGDGSTLYDDETGTPLASHMNTSGGHQTVIIGVDNGHFNSGNGATKPAFSSYTARVV